jgi:20S proteasome alpha/beta subunit
MDSLIAIKGKDFIVMAADTVNAYSVLRMKVTSNIMSRTTMIKFGISMEKNYSLLEDNTQMF